MANFSNTDKSPVRWAGPRGQDGFMSVEQVFFTGTTGQVGTAYGTPGVTVSRTATGAYSVTYPQTKECVIIPGVQAPTGNHYNITVTDNQPGSGTAKFNITRTFTFQGSGAVIASGSVQNTNPASGTIANLVFFVSPITKF